MLQQEQLKDLHDLSIKLNFPDGWWQQEDGWLHLRLHGNSISQVPNSLMVKTSLSTPTKTSVNVNLLFARINVLSNVKLYFLKIVPFKNRWRVWHVIIYLFFTNFVTTQGSLESHSTHLLFVYIFKHPQKRHWWKLANISPSDSAPFMTRSSKSTFKKTLRSKFDKVLLSFFYIGINEAFRRVCLDSHSSSHFSFVTVFTSFFLLPRRLLSKLITFWRWLHFSLEESQSFWRKPP